MRLLLMRLTCEIPKPEKATKVEGFCNSSSTIFVGSCVCISPPLNFCLEPLFQMIAHVGLVEYEKVPFWTRLGNGMLLSKFLESLIRIWNLFFWIWVEFGSRSRFESKWFGSRSESESTCFPSWGCPHWLQPPIERLYFMSLWSVNHIVASPHLYT